VGEHYQTANRLAHVCWLRDQGVEAWFAHLFFLDDDTHTQGGRATSFLTWQDEWRKVEEEMGLASAGNGWFGHAYLPALAADELIRPATLASQA